jgi:biotin transport system permease protein
VRAVRVLDPRVKLACGLAMGVLVWRAGPVGLGLYLALPATLLFLFRQQWPGRAAVVRNYLAFVLFWMLAKWGLDVLWGMDWALALEISAWLGVRLVILLMVGLCLGLTTSSRQLGMAANWALRPVLGKRAWKASLALAIMIHSLPLAWQALAQVRLALTARRLRVGRVRRALLTVQGVLRLLGRRAWEQAVAVASRRLDRAEAWRPAFTGSASGLSLGAAVLAVLAVVAFI